jgi:hypothetical protein
MAAGTQLSVNPWTAFSTMACAWSSSEVKSAASQIMHNSVLTHCAPNHLQSPVDAVQQLGPSCITFGHIHLFVAGLRRDRAEWTERVWVPSKIIGRSIILCEINDVLSGWSMDEFCKQVKTYCPLDESWLIFGKWEKSIMHAQRDASLYNGKY